MPKLQKYTLSADADAGGWVLKRDGAQRAAKRFKTKGEAVDSLGTRFKSSPASVKIQKQDGTLEEERTYPRAMDPRSSKG